MTEEALNMRTGTVNYHVHKPHRQAFELDAGGIAGNLISPELAPTLVEVRDDRASEEPLRFDTDWWNLREVRAASAISKHLDGRRFTTTN